MKPYRKGTADVYQTSVSFATFTARAERPGVLSHFAL
jgi:hypothetical protein